MPLVPVTACQGHTPWYTCLIPVLVCMFHPSSGRHVLSYGTALTNAQLCFGAGGMPPALAHFSSYGTALADTQLCLGISILPISIHIQILYLQVLTAMPPVSVTACQVGCTLYPSSTDQLEAIRQVLSP